MSEVKNSWKDLAHSRAGDILPQLRAVTTDTALAVLETLKKAGHTIQAVEGQLRIRPSLEADLRPRVRGHKSGLLVLLAPRRLYSSPATWEEERDDEKDMIRRRMAACSNPKTISRLSALLMTSGDTYDEWLTFAKRIADVEAELREGGELPPVEYPVEPAYPVIPVESPGESGPCPF